MFVCPYDAKWCNRPACHLGSCELTGEAPLIACIGCGTVTETLPRLRLCRDCIVVEIDVAKGGT